MRRGSQNGLTASDLIQDRDRAAGVYRYKRKGNARDPPSGERALKETQRGARAATLLIIVLV